MLINLNCECRVCGRKITMDNLSEELYCCTSCKSEDKKS